MSKPVGAILLDKPEGPTSHDMVDVVRRALVTERVGHAGTLDPPASGLLAIAVGPATRFLRYVQDLPKAYEATGVLGVQTSTLDAAGEVVDRRDVDVAPDEVRRAAGSFIGVIEQIPPAVSAIKVDGERAYRRARRGEDVELAPRQVTVHDLEITDVADDVFSLRVCCSSGTYVRSLVADIGDRLGCGAHCSRLRRTAIGHLDVDDAVAPEEVSPGSVRGLDEVLSHLTRVEVGTDDAVAAANGRRIAVPGPDEAAVLVVGGGGVVGVFERREGMLRAQTVLGSG